MPTPGAGSGDRKGVAAAAGRGGVRILDLEIGAHQILDEVDLGAGHEVERYRIDHHLDAVPREGDVVLPARVVEAEPVLESRTAAARDGEAQERLRRPVLGLKKSDAPRGAVADDDAALGADAAIHGPAPQGSMPHLLM